MRKILIIGLIIVVAGTSLFALKPKTNFVDPAMKRLIKQATGLDPRLYTDRAYKTGHEIAQQNFSKNLSSLLSMCGDPNLFHGGCLQGVVMGLSDKINPKLLAAECLKFDVSNKAYSINCSHALGHVNYENSQSLDKASCAGYFSGLLFDDCMMGLFMEYSLGTHEKIMSGKEMLASYKDLDCAKVDASVALDCAAAVGAYSIYYPGYILKKTAERCNLFVAKQQFNACVSAAEDSLQGVSDSVKQEFLADLKLI